MLFERRAAATRRRADRARDGRDWRKAATLYRRWLATRPDDGPGWRMLGEVLEAGDEPVEADRAYRMAATLGPDDAGLMRRRGDLAVRLGRTDEALDLLRRSHAVDGDAAVAALIARLAPPEPEPDEVRPDDPADAAAGGTPDDPSPAPEIALPTTGEAALADDVAPPDAGDPGIPASADEPPAPGEPAVAEAPSDHAPADDETVAAPPPVAGAVEHRDHQIVVGWAAPATEDDFVTFSTDGAVVARAWPDRARPRGEGFEFRTMLPVDRPTAVHARRASDGAALVGSPFDASPRPAHVVARRRASDARAAVLKPFAPPTGREIALFVTYTATGRVKPHVEPYVRALAGQGIATLLIVVADRPVNVAPELLALADGALARENVGYDFAAWAHALALHPEAYAAPTLYLVNDSVVGPPAGDRFGRLIGRVRASAGDVVALTESHEHRWHVQSYFLAFKPRALASQELIDIFAGVDIVHDKDEIIRRFELPLASRMEEAGCRVDVLFGSDVACNPMLGDWRGLLERDFPFVKLLLLRGAFPQFDPTGWREAMAAAGFDVAMVDTLLRACAEAVPHDHDGRLSVHLAPPPHAGEALKVALYGPWNYDNGLGGASRNLIGALRRTGARLNLHPIEKPFHIHRPLAPAVPVVDFDGPADVAVVHLNPDSWHLLTDAQRVGIAAARRRIGYWVWEMAHIPDAWWRDFGSVDRIWAPSRYCARLFAAQDGAPVDVVPHPVPVPMAASPGPDRRAALLRDLGVDPARRVVLYVFDGSSYLVRKNPAALIRAFAASGLAERGWTLLLKTKHLMDRREAGLALAELAGGERAVTLVDRPLDAEALADLVAAVDVYASPHASEGFGLTIAEAMAAGRTVIATDFGGSADLLDEVTGFPVRAHPWRLEEDHGHYVRGGEWARIDEPALSRALARAADAVEAGDRSRGDAARARVADRLSFAAVGSLVAASLAETMVAPPGPEPVRVVPLDLAAGVPAAAGTGDARVRLSALEPDGAATADGLADGDEAAWVAFAPAGALLSPLFASSVLRHAAARPDAELFYADDVAARPARAIDQFRLKPAFDRTLLCAQDYVGAPVIVRATTLAALGGLDPARGTAAVADLLFRADAAGRSIARIPEVLLAHPGERVVAGPDDYAAMLRAQPALDGYDVAPGIVPATFALRRRMDGDEPPVTIVVPTRRGAGPDGAAAIERLLDAIENTDWPMARLSVLVGDDVPDVPDWSVRPRPYALRRVATPRASGEPFNYAAKMNRLWRDAGTEQIVLMNDDAMPLSPDWLRALQTFALDRRVGGVGARLLYPDGRLQHAGVVPHCSSVAHAWLGRARVEGTAHEWARVHREWSMVTGAVFATRRTTMEELGGFDEAFTLEYNDIDLCLRMRALGYRIVYTPHAAFTHVEKLSRGATPPTGDTTARFMRRWGDWLAHDPAWHPGLRRNELALRPRIEPSWYV